MEKLDLKRFRQDLKTARASRTTSAPGRPAITGTMAVVRNNLDLFDRLRADDPELTWAHIAVSLGKQDVMQRDGQPITAKRLCALVSTIRKQKAAQADAAARRAARADAVMAAPLGRRQTHADAAPAVIEGQRLKLAAELTSPEPSETSNRSRENELRRANFAKHDDLFKKDKR